MGQCHLEYGASSPIFWTQAVRILYILLEDETVEGIHFYTKDMSKLSINITKESFIFVNFSGIRRIEKIQPNNKIIGVVIFLAEKHKLDIN